MLESVAAALPLTPPATLTSFCTIVGVIMTETNCTEIYFLLQQWTSKLAPNALTDTDSGMCTRTHK